MEVSEMIRDIQDVRIDLWCKVAVATAQASNSVKPRSCSDWADFVLKDFDDRFFPKTTKEESTK